MYTEQFKEAMVVKMTMPGGFNAYHLSKDVGIPYQTLLRWKRESVTVEGMGKEKDQRRLRDWSAEEKLEAIKDTAKLSEQELGEYLRREGLHSIQLEQWTKEFLDGQKSILRGPKKKREISVEKKKIKELEKELRRKDKALAEASALLILKKKAELIWGLVGDEEST